MRHFLTTTAVLAALFAATPLLAQEQDLQRLIEDAIDATEPVIGPEPRPAPSDFGFLAPEPDLLALDELDDLLAPVALYPDALLAQVLVASTFPLQIVRADRLLDQAEADGASDADLTRAIDEGDWDPSVLVLLAGFPDVIRRMADDLDDTERLGIAMAQQDGDVLESVQRLRLRAEETGYLADNDAQVVERDGDRIVIEPADPEIIYVPRYDETRAFVSAPTAPTVIQQPGANLLSNPFAAGAIGFGSALLVNELFGDDEADNDKDGWDDYWRRDRRAIDWREREVYPRAYGWDDDAERRRANAWSRERDQNWDRQARRWRAEADDARRAAWRERREERVWDVRRDPRTGDPRLRLRDWNDARASFERREAIEARRDRREAEARDEAREAERERARAIARRDAEDDARRRAAQRREAAERERDAGRNDTARDRDRERSERAAEAAQAERRREAAAERAREERRAEEATETRRARAIAERERDAARAEAERRREQEAARTTERERDQARAAAERQRTERAEAQAAAARRERQAEQAAEAERQAARVARARAAEQQEAEARRRAQAAAERDAAAQRERRQAAENQEQRSEEEPRRRRPACGPGETPQRNDCRPRN